MQNAQRDLDKTGKKMQNVGKNLSLAVTAPFAALSAISLSNFNKQAQAVAQVESGLRSTGESAGYTSEQLQKMASELQNNSLFGDEEILKGATSQLLTFTNIAGEQFARTQQAALDLATRLDGDLKSSSIQLGKALNDPIANLSALSRSGIQFSKDQKEVINSLASTGRLAEAQTIILDELEKQYGGSAAAAAKAGTGPLKQLQNSIGDLTEDFGMLIMDALIPFVDRVKQVVANFQNLDIGTKKTILVVGAFAASIGPAIIVLGTLIRNISTIIPLIKALTVAIAANPIGAFAIAITALAGGLLLANSRFSPLTDATKEFNSLTATATQNVAKEKAELEKLLKIAQDDTLSKEQRSLAVKELNRLSPEYLGNLTLEKINTDEAAIATEKYTQALLKKAKVQAAEEKLVEVQKKLLDLSNGNLEGVAPSLGQNIVNALTSVGDAAVFASKSAETIGENYSQEFSELKKLEQGLLNFISTNEDLTDSLKKTGATNVTPVINTNAKITGTAELDFEFDETELEKRFEDLSILDERMAELGANTAEALGQAGETRFFDGITLQYDEFLENLDEKNEELSEKLVEAQVPMQEFAAGAAQFFGEAIGAVFSGSASIAGILGGLLKLMAQFVKNLGQSLIQAGTAALAAKKLFANPVTAIAAGVALIALSSVLQSAFSDLPAFESGGVVPGNSFYGDKILARVNSGELILNQRQQQNLFAQLNNVNDDSINLSGRLSVSGDELQLILDRAARKRGRRS